MTAYLTSPTADTTHANDRLARSLPIALLQELRPKQWLKNGLLFFGLIYSLHLTDPTSVARALLAFVVFCSLSSAGYIFNDFRDLVADRLHPTKQFRPLASGELSQPAAVAAGSFLGLFSAIVALWFDPGFAAICAVYLILSVTYSLYWKHLVLIDLFAISGGFVLRVVAGSVAIAVGVSPWLYVCTILGSLLIALGKRRSEVLAMPEEAADALAHRATLEHYTVEFLDRLIVLVAAASVIAYSLYTFSAENVPHNHSMMLTAPIVLYGVFRYLFLVQVRGEGGNPEDLLLGDRSLAIAVTLFLALSAGILYLSPPGA